MLKNPRSATINESLDRLAEGGIAIHAQVVLCPGINDGEQLKKTITDLENEGLIRTEQNRVRLSRKGMSFLDSITAMFTSQEIFPH